MALTRQGSITTLHAMANDIGDSMSDPESDSVDCRPVLSVADLGTPSSTTSARLPSRQNYHCRDDANTRTLKPTRATPAGSSGLATPILYATRLPADADFLTSQIEALEHALADAQLRMKQPDGNGRDEVDRPQRDEVGDSSAGILDDGRSASEPNGHGKDKGGHNAPDVATSASFSEHDDHVRDASLVPAQLVTATSTSEEHEASWREQDTQRRLAVLEDTLSASRLREATLMASLRHVKDVLLQQQMNGTTAMETSASVDTSIGTACGLQTRVWGRRNGQLVAPTTGSLTLAAQRLNHVREGMMIADKAMSEIESFHDYHSQISGFILSTAAERQNKTAPPSPWRTLRTT